MKIFGKKNKLQPDWKFSQKGNLWKFVFAGGKIIAGETRDTENKLLYLFTLETETGECHLKNFLFEDGNYWLSIEGANDRYVFLNRYQNPELPYHKNIIALDIRNGNKIWENEECQYYFSTNDEVYGYRSKFESFEYFRINLSDGSSSPLPDEKVSEIMHLKQKTDEDSFNEYYDYPKPHSIYPADENTLRIFSEETGNLKNTGEIEYVLRKNLLLFNYYTESDTQIHTGRKTYTNKFSIYNTESGEKLFSDILNESTNYNVPDNFFIKDNRLYYLREKKEIVSIKID